MAGVTSVVIDGTSYLVDDINAVDFSEDQGLSEQQQEQGRSNIGAAALAALAGKADKADLDALEGTVGELSDDVDGLTEALADKASAIVDTASGAIASFPDGAAVPAKDITIGIEPVQSGSGDPSPENVRPISGWTGANVTRMGKNLFDESTANTPYYVKSDGTFTNKMTDTRPTATIQVQAYNGTTLVAYVSTSGTYPSRTIGTITIDSAVTQLRIKHNGASLDLPIYIPWTAQGTFTVSCLIPSNDPTTVGGLVIKDIQVEEGSTATPYVPYTGTTFPISWQSSAGTVYGGTLDVTTGLLTVDRAIVDLGTLTWKYDGVINGCSRFNALISEMKKDDSNLGSGLSCSIYKIDGSPVGGGGVNNTICHYSQRIYVNNNAYSNATTFKSAMSGVQLVYELATPQTYQLTPVEIEMLLGENNVWADTGDSTVTYRADTKLYIQKINAPTDDDMIADVQIASGKYFIIGGNLYKSTTTIPAGDTINPGSNCILTNLADALNALNT